MNKQSTPSIPSCVRPTLYIGLGGAGEEVLLSLRRKILNNVWDTSNSKKRVSSLGEFSAAQFIQLDLDTSINSRKAQAEDFQFNAIKFDDAEKVTEPFNLVPYMRDQDSLDSYPHIKKWLPFTTNEIRKLAIDTSKGAGSIRAISRLWFFDKYEVIKNKIHQTLLSLSAASAYEKQLEQLDIKVDASQVNIVVVASAAGGTGSGAFLDMGWLVSSVAKSAGIEANIELMLLMPTGYTNANTTIPEANTYAALAELEHAMLGNKTHAGPWSALDKPMLGEKPYTEVFLVNTINTAQQRTLEIKDIYEMLASSLLDNFIYPELAIRKNANSINQNYYKKGVWQAPLLPEKYKELTLSFARSYSAQGRAEIVLKQDLKNQLAVGVLATRIIKTLLKDREELERVHFGVLLIIKNLEASNATLQKLINQEHCTVINIPLKTDPIISLSDQQIQESIMSVAEVFGGFGAIADIIAVASNREPFVEKIKQFAHSTLFPEPLITTDTSTASNSNSAPEELSFLDSILNKLKEVTNNLALSTPQTVETNLIHAPLIFALEQMDVQTRAGLFNKWLNAAMPWLDVNVTDQFGIKAEQYKCMIAVAHEKEFQQKFGSEIIACLPIQTGITADQLFFVNSSVMGNAVCYTELSGIVLPALKTIHTWRQSYDKKINDLPVHTHIDVTQFGRIVMPTREDATRLIQDFKYYLLALITGVLTKPKYKKNLVASYEIEISRGDKRLIGNEKSIRLNGLSLNYREIIKDRVNEVLANADEYLLATLAILASYYTTEVYTPNVSTLPTNNTGETASSTIGLASVMATEICKELTEKAMRKGLSDLMYKQISEQLLLPQQLPQWTRSLPDSNLDAYSWEVKAPDYEDEPRLKRVINEELFEPGKLATFVFSKLTFPPSLSTLRKPEDLESLNEEDFPPPFLPPARTQMPPPLPFELPDAGVQLPPPLMLDVALSQIPPPISPIPKAVDRLAILEALRSASGLKDDGILTQAEFDALKAEFLKKLVS